MSSLQELYGDNFRGDFLEQNRQYVAGLAVSNIGSLNFREVKHDFSSLFENDSNDISDRWFSYIKTRAEKMNQFLILDRITDKRMLPRIIPEEKITYIRIVDTMRKKVYIIYMTPYILDTF
jgi:hypothetical protein